MPEFPVLAIRHSTSKMHTCGFCTFGNAHDLCPSGTLNGDNTTVLRCDCGCPRSLQIKCFSCGLREDMDPEFEILTRLKQELWLEEHAGEHEINPLTWHCFDTDACNARIEHRMANNPTIQMIREIQATAEARLKVERATRPRNPDGPRPSSGACVHCGEPTKGGKFLPGHDAAWLSTLVTEVREGKTTAADQIGLLTEAKASDALIAKFEKRVGASV